ncbi:MAG: hypothetical protein HY760_03140 [Nitrospirae bacterium]|nr:hypothetical protein [Nitrospirota bacterium]
MSERYRSFFGLKCELFAADLMIEELLETPASQDGRERFHQAVRLDIKLSGA